MKIPTLNAVLLNRLLRNLDNHAFLFALLGIISGILSALIIVAFRLIIESSQKMFLPVELENYEQLPLVWQIFLPSTGFFLIALYLFFFGGNFPRVGIVHVVDRMRNHQGFFPSQNIVSQFITGALAIISGQSAGREGAAVHLGAGVSSLLGSRLRLNNRNMRTLVACGSAAAISASFNTPLAGVIFSMEVILLEYSVYSFIPIILSSVCASIICQAVFGNELIFLVPEANLHSLTEIPFLVLMAILIGVAASLAIRILDFSSRVSKQWNLWQRFGLAALVTVCGVVISPQIMGLGYDTVSDAMLGELGWQILLIVAFTKIVVTSMVVGLGVPSGFIGPSLVMGACLGGAIGISVSHFSPIAQSDISLYVTIGMAAMMSTLLKAPLAALIAALEFTGNSHILLPAMLVIVTSNLICNDLFRQSSFIEVLLDTQVDPHRENSLREWLQNTHVHSLAVTGFKEHDRYITFKTAQNFCNQQIEYILITDERRPAALIPLHTLAFHLRFSNNGQMAEDETIDLLSMPGEKKDLAELSSESTLEEALEVFENKQVNAVYLVNQNNPAGHIFISGILLKDHVDQYFRS